MLTRWNSDGVGRLLHIDTEFTEGIDDILGGVVSKHFLPLNCASALGSVHVHTASVLQLDGCSETIAAGNAPLPALHESIGSDATDTPEPPERNRLSPRDMA